VHVVYLHAVMTMYVVRKHPPQRQQHGMMTLGHTVHRHQTVMHHVGLLIYTPGPVQM